MKSVKSMTVDELKALVENPPDHLRPMAEMYRSAIATRQQAEARREQARAALGSAEVTAHRALGAEGALRDALIVMAQSAETGGPE